MVQAMALWVAGNKQYITKDGLVYGLYYWDLTIFYGEFFW